MYKLVYSQPQLSPTFSASVSPHAALPLTTHSPDQGAQERFSVQVCSTERQNRHTVNPDLPLKRHLIF